MISLIYNWPLSKSTFTGLLSKSNSIAPWPEIHFYCPFGRNHPLCQLLELFLLFRTSTEKTIIHLVSKIYLWLTLELPYFQILLEPVTLNYLLSWIPFTSFFSWENFQIHIITVSVPPLLNKDLLSRTSTLQLMLETNRWFKLLLYETRYQLNRATMYASLLSNATP